MSARQPFQPRPASRAVNRESDIISENAPAFPLSSQALGPTASSKENQSNQPHISSSTGSLSQNNLYKKPLNLSGFSKKKDERHSTVFQNGENVHVSQQSFKPRRSFEGIQRPPTVFSGPPRPATLQQIKTKTQVEALKIAAPRPSPPVFPGDPGAVLISLADSDNNTAFSSPEHAHISSSSGDPVLSLGGRTPYLTQSTTLEPEIQDMSVMQEQATGNIMMHSPFQPSEESGGHRLAQEQFIEPHGVTLQPNGANGALKRVQASGHEAYDLSYKSSMQPASKRYKVAQTDDDMHHDERSWNVSSRRSTPALRSSTPPMHMKHDFLEDIFGRGFSAHADEHVEKYQAAEKKWAECSMEEWERGADELADKFGTLIDFVKGKMSAKMLLQASLHQKVAARKDLLSARETELQEAKRQIVKDATVLHCHNT